MEDALLLLLLFGIVSRKLFLVLLLRLLRILFLISAFFIVNGSFLVLRTRIRHVSLGKWYRPTCWYSELE